jgi:hypothetical protein
MKYTKEQLEVMNDFEVSKAICVLLGFDVNGVTESWNQMINAVPNLCEDWSRLMPLAFSHKISLLEGDESWSAYQKFGIYEDVNYRISHGHFYGDKSPQRAIACCLILVLQEQ